MDPQEAQQQAMHIAAVLLPMIVLIGTVFSAFFVFLFWRILSKAGLAGPLALLVLVPGIGWIIVACILAFSEWRVVPAPYVGLQPYPPPPPNYPPPPRYTPPPPTQS